MKTPAPSRVCVHPCTRAERGAALVLLLALASFAPAMAAEPPAPRLFTTAEQRAQLDRVRHEVPAEPEPDAAPPSRAAAPPEPPPPVHLRGFVRRSGGPEAVWVNDDSTLGDVGLGEGLHVDSGRIEGNDVVIRLRDGRTIRLKPGQTWDPERGAVRDAFGQ